MLRDGGRSPQFLDGIQAHLSSFASHKVPEVVKKFPHKIRLEEVSRLSTWPGQFKEKEVTEENIALYIFAKDAERYLIYLLFHLNCKKNINDSLMLLASPFVLQLRHALQKAG